MLCVEVGTRVGATRDAPGRREFGIEIELGFELWRRRARRVDLSEVGQRVARYAAASGRSSQSEGRLVLDVTVMATACGLRVPPELSLLGKTLLNLEAVSQALDPHLDVKRVVEEHLDHVMRERMRKSLSLAHLASEAMELQSLVRGAPRKVSFPAGHLIDPRGDLNPATEIMVTPAPLR